MYESEVSIGGLRVGGHHVEDGRVSLADRAIVEVAGVVVGERGLKLLEK